MVPNNCNILNDITFNLCYTLHGRFSYSTPQKAVLRFNFDFLAAQHNKTGVYKSVTFHSIGTVNIFTI